MTAAEERQQLIESILSKFDRLLELRRNETENHNKDIKQT